jgi:hypothetical protein
MSAEAMTIEHDTDNFENLANQILNRNTPQPSEKQDDKRWEKEERSSPKSDARRYYFEKGDERFEIDDDAEIEFTADKQPVRMTLRELRERAAGDVAIKNRMHSLAEEKKKVQRTLKDFASIAKNDPLGALEYISERAKEADTEFEYQSYLEQLAEQAEKLSQMDEKERKAWEAEKKLGKVEQDLSLKEREVNAVRRKQELLSDFPEIGDHEFGQMVDAVLENEALADRLENEHDVLDAVEDLIVETLTQRDIIHAINEINPEYAHDDELIFALSDQLRLNPDFDEEDIRDVIDELVAPGERDHPIRTLSHKNRVSYPSDRVMREQGASDYELLRSQLLERREQQREAKRG